MKTKRIDTVEHRLVFLEKGDRWPEALTEAIERAGFSSGTFQGTAVLRDVELRSYDAGLGQREPGRRTEGPIEAVVLSGAFGLSRGSLALSTQTVLAVRDGLGDRIAAGSLESARIDGGEVLVRAFVGTDLVRAHRADAGVWLFQLEAEVAGTTTSSPRAEARAEPRPVTAASSAWAALADASAAAVSTPTAESRPIAGRPPASARPSAQVGEEDEALVEQGAVIEHFAFGEGDVMKSDGERVHVRFEKDGRIREFSLAVLRVTMAGTRRGRPYFKVAKRT